MEKLKGIKIQYLHPSAPPMKIKMDTVYTIGLDGKKFYIDDGDKKIEIRYEVMVQLFKPVNGNWDELLKEDVLEKEVKLDKK